MKSHAGGLGRVGMYYRFADVSAVMFGVGYGHMTYDGPGGSLNATSG